MKSTIRPTVRLLAGLTLVLLVLTGGSLALVSGAAGADTVSPIDVPPPTDVPTLGGPVTPPVLPTDLVSTDPATDPATNPATDPATDPATNPATNPATDPATVPATDPATVPATDPAATDPATSDPASGDPASGHPATSGAYPPGGGIPSTNPGSVGGGGTVSTGTDGGVIITQRPVIIRPSRVHRHKPITTVHRLRIVAPSRPHPHRKAWPITLTIKTIPALSSAEFQFDGRWVTTDQYGVATVTEEHNLNLHTLRIGDLGQEGSDLRFHFTRWVGQRNPAEQLQPVVTGLPMRADATIFAGITVQYPVTPRVTNQGGSPVPDKDISAMTVRSDTGRFLPMTPGRTSWLDGLTPTFAKNVLLAQPIGYTLQTVMVHATNVVDAGKQRFAPEESPTVHFTGLFFDLTLTAKDSLFGTALGRTATIRYPDGMKQTVPLGTAKRVTLYGLPRGKYDVSISAEQAIVSAGRVSLSRSMTFTERAVTALDIVVILVTALLVAGVLLLIGRAGAVQRLVRRLVPGRFAGGRTRRSVRVLRTKDASVPMEKLLR